MTSPCRICGAASWIVHYHGPIRLGRFGQVSRQSHHVWRCGGCGAGWLDIEALDYGTSEYRELVDGANGPDHYYKVHDAEQADKLRLVGAAELRGAVVADFGCGGGSFLDLASGMAERTLAIDPAREFHGALAGHGHEVFSHGSDAAPAWRGAVDLAVCFSVIEHVDDVRGLLSDIRILLKPGGRALVSTPNWDDWLLELLPDDYARFFYRRVHRWYFNAPALCRLAELAGFRRARPFHVHRFDLSNLLLWTRDRRPSGLGTLAVPSGLGASLAPGLEATGRSDYLYAWLET